MSENTPVSLNDKYKGQTSFLKYIGYHFGHFAVRTTGAIVGALGLGALAKNRNWSIPISFQDFDGRIQEARIPLHQGMRLVGVITGGIATSLLLSYRDWKRERTTQLAAVDFNEDIAELQSRRETHSVTEAAPPSPEAKPEYLERALSREAEPEPVAAGRS